MTVFGQIHGVTTLGERGQVVIPAEVRKAMNLNSGDRLVVFYNQTRGIISLAQADYVSRVTDIVMSKVSKLGRLNQDILDLVVDSLATHSTSTATDAHNPADVDTTESDEASSAIKSDSDPEAA